MRVVEVEGVKDPRLTFGTRMRLVAVLFGGFSQLTRAQLWMAAKV